MLFLNKYKNSGYQLLIYQKYKRSTNNVQRKGKKIEEYKNVNKSRQKKEKWIRQRIFFFFFGGWGGGVGVGMLYQSGIEKEKGLHP